MNERIHCEDCSATFAARKNYLRHYRAKHGNESFSCELCHAKFNRKDILQRHQKTHEKGVKRKSEIVPPSTVAAPVPSTSTENHQSKKKKPKLNGHMLKVETAFQGRLKTCRLDNADGLIDIKEFLESKRDVFCDTISEELLRNQLKVNCFLLCIYEKASDDGVITKDVDFKTKNAVVLTTTNLDELYSSKIDKLVRESEEFENAGSGWTLSEIVYLEIRINKFNPLHASKYIDLPIHIKLKHAVVNVENIDEKCFMWAVLSALYPTAANSNRTSSYEQYITELNFKGINFPVKLTDIHRFEKNNDEISVNVYGLDEKYKVFPLYICENEKQKHVDLLYITENGNSHFTWIKNLSRLTSSQLSKHHGKTFICRRCLLHFTTPEVLAKHKIDCNNHGAVRVEMPENPWLRFENIQHILEVPYVVFADFETLTKPIDTCEPSASASYINAYQQHEAYSFCYFVSCADGTKTEPVVYRGPDANKIFFEAIVKEAEKIRDIYKNPLPMANLTFDELRDFELATTCYLCGKEFSETNYKVRH